MKLLAIETSSAVGSLALLDGDSVAQREIATPRAQSESVLPGVGELLDEAGLALGSLDAIAFGRGPGSFSGIRLGAAVAQGLALSKDLPVIPVSSLAAAAQRAWREHGAERSLVCVDARMGEVYWALFNIEGGLAEHDGPERLGAPAKLVCPPDEPWSAVGDGFAEYSAELQAPLVRAAAVFADCRPTARDLLPRARRDFAAGQFCAATAALPLYLRGEDAWRRQRSN